MAKLTFSETLSIVEEFFDNAIDGQLTFDEYMANYGHKETELARENYRVCTRSLNVVKGMGLESQLNVIYESIPNSYEWGDLTVNAQNYAILRYKENYIDDPLSRGYDKGIHLEPIEKQIEFMRSYLSNSERLFSDLGIMVFD